MNARGNLKDLSTYKNKTKDIKRITCKGSADRGDKKSRSQADHAGRHGQRKGQIAVDFRDGLSMWGLEDLKIKSACSVTKRLMGLGMAQRSPLLTLYVLQIISDRFGE